MWLWDVCVCVFLNTFACLSKFVAICVCMCVCVRDTANDFF